MVCDKVIRCGYCNRLVDCDGDPGPIGAIRVPLAHGEVPYIDNRFALMDYENEPVCPGSEMNGQVEQHPDYCRCGSGLEWRDLHDARGIFVARVCDGCEQSVKAQYRADIFNDSNYETDEPIEEDY